MKFNFEKIKRDAKKVVLLGGAALAVSASTPNKELGDNFYNSEKNIELQKNTPEKTGQRTITFEEAQRGGNYNEGFTSLKIEKIEEVSEENEILLENIKKLEEKFSNITNERSEIVDGGISIISNQDLTGEIDSVKNVNLDGVTRTSPLENRYITNVLNNYILNNINEIKLLDKSSLALEATKEADKMSADGAISLKNNGYKHFIPEYYFVIDQKQENDSEITFTIKIISSKEETPIREISIVEKLPEGDQMNDPKFIDLVDNKIIPDIGEKIKEIVNNINN